MAEHYYTVGVHGAPTPETAPHGYFYVADGDWTEGVQFTTVERAENRHRAVYPLENEDSVWWAAPAPPTEQAPPPVPVARWCACVGHHGRHYVSFRGFDDPTDEETAEAADALNALDRDGVAWGPGRPMSELPETGRVLVRLKDGLIIARANTIQAGDFVRWWPLPGEAQ